MSFRGILHRSITPSIYGMIFILNNFMLKKVKEENTHAKFKKNVWIVEVIIL